MCGERGKGRGGERGGRGDRGEVKRGRECVWREG